MKIKIKDGGIMKKALITGGATGIGKATAQLFAKKGYDVFVTVNKTELDYDGVTAIKCDLRNENDIINAFKKIGNIDVLVNNAAVSLVKQINDTTAEEYDDLTAVNARSYYLCAREAVKLMIKNHSGAIINIASMWGQSGGSCETAYSVSKAAVIGLTRSLAQETAMSNITVNCVSPGIIDTRMNDMFDKNELAREVPLGRLGEPEEVAAAVLFFAESSYITGQILGVNGGII